jgi:hypothetical protein
MGWGAPRPGMPPRFGPPAAPSAAVRVPWEGSGGVMRRWWETMTAASFRGRAFFTAVRANDDALAACSFSTLSGAIIGSLLGMSITLASLIGGAAMWQIFPGGVGRQLATAAAGVGVGLGLTLWLSIGLVFAACGFIGPWLLGGMHHLALVLLDGADKDYTQSVRVAAYAGASSLLFVTIPIVGWLAAFAFNIINHVVGYDAVHGCGRSKAFFAWAGPNAICCCCYWATFIFVLAS